MGLPGAGKTTLAQVLAPQLDAVLFNGDDMRKTMSADLGFSLKDRIEQARRMGLMCDLVNKLGRVAIADFVCPTHHTRAAFGKAFTIWMDRIESGRYADTNAMFEPPKNYDLRVPFNGTPDYWAAIALGKLNSIGHLDLVARVFSRR